MSAQVVAAKMAEGELKDIPYKELVSPVTPRAEDKEMVKKEANSAASTPSATLTPEAALGDQNISPSPMSSPKMPQASAMKRTDPQQNGGESFVNRDGTVAEAPRMKKVTLMLQAECAQIGCWPRLLQYLSWLTLAFRCVVPLW